MSSKLSVVVIKSKSVDTTSNLNKMIVHLEQILTEKENVELKTRQSITDALVKSADFIIFSGWDSALLSSFFHTIGLLEKSESDKKVFLFDEPGTNCWTDLNRLLTFGMDIERIDPSIFDKIIDCWNYRDIMSYIDLKVRKLKKSDADSGTVATI